MALKVNRKPRVVEKLKSFHDYVKANGGQIGFKQRGIDLNINNACNLRCEHCFTNSPKAEGVKHDLGPEIVAKIADQADELGIFEWDLQGGELLLRPERLYETLAAMGTERFYVYVTTNGYFMTDEIASNLRELGVDRVSVSIDSMDSAAHDKFRGRKDSWRRAIEALQIVQEAGMTPYLNITVGRFNAQSEDLISLLEYSKDHRYTTLLNVATPSGMWQRLDEILVDDSDRAFLIEMRKKYRNILRNLWDPFDRNYEGVIGCNTINRLYITPTGDVLPCPYVHIKVGNVFEQTLKEISEYGFRLPPFGQFSPICLAGEDRDFITNYMRAEGTSIFNPRLASDLFPAESLLPPVQLPGS